MKKVIEHYDALIDESNDPCRDPKPLQDYMDKWDGQSFTDALDLSKKKVVLEIGIGTGRIARKVAPNCEKLWGVDISPKTVERAEENLKAFDNVELICADFLEFECDCTFDVIYSSLTSMHFEDKRGFIDKVSRLLKENGRFVLSIDKNQSDYIDMGSRKVKIYPDKPEVIIECVKLTGMSIAEQYETEFAHVFVCLKQ